MKVKLTDIVDAIEAMDRYSEYFLNKRTGELLAVMIVMFTFGGLFLVRREKQEDV